MTTIFGIREKLTPMKQELSDIIHETMIDILGIEEGIRSHRFILLSRDDFFFPQNSSDSFTVIEMNIVEGQPIDRKKRLIHSLFENIHSKLGIALNDIDITLNEQPAHCRGYNGLTGDEAQMIL